MQAGRRSRVPGLAAEPLAADTWHPEPAISVLQAAVAPPALEAGAESRVRRVNPSQSSIARRIEVTDRCNDGSPASDRDHLILTVAPVSSSSFLSFSASSLERPVLTSLGAASTRSLASLRPRRRGRADHLDDLDLVGADRLEHDVELGLGRRRRLGRRRPAAAGRRRPRRPPRPPGHGLLSGTSSVEAPRGPSC